MGRKLGAAVGLAVAVVVVLRWMAVGERPADIPENVPTHDGDLLAFLPGRRAIRAAIKELEDLVDDDDLASKV